MATGRTRNHLLILFSDTFKYSCCHGYCSVTAVVAQLQLLLLSHSCYGSVTAVIAQLQLLWLSCYCSVTAVMAQSAVIAQSQLLLLSHSCYCAQLQLLWPHYLLLLSRCVCSSQQSITWWSWGSPMLANPLSLMLYGVPFCPKVSIVDVIIVDYLIECH